jgi:hypothetical protein
MRFASSSAPADETLIELRTTTDLERPLPISDRVEIINGCPLPFRSMEMNEPGQGLQLMNAKVYHAEQPLNPTSFPHNQHTKSHTLYQLAAYCNATRTPSPACPTASITPMFRFPRLPMSNNNTLFRLIWLVVRSRTHIVTLQLSWKSNHYAFSIGIAHLPSYNTSSCLMCWIRCRCISSSHGAFHPLTRCSCCERIAADRFTTTVVLLASWSLALRTPSNTQRNAGRSQVPLWGGTKGWQRSAREKKICKHQARLYAVHICGRAGGRYNGRR